MAWIYSMIRQGTALAVLWYVLRRRSKSFGNIGLRWNLKEVGFGLGLFVLAWIVAACSYSVVRLVVDPAVLARQPDVDRMLFGGHVASTAIVFAFLNPFFEELIVRAYVISEIKALTNRISVAVAVSVVLQTSYHFYQGAPAALMHSGTFLIFALYYAKTNRIGAPIVAHLLLDVWPIVSYMARLHQRSF